MFNHLPVIGTPIVVALLLWGIVRGSREISRMALAAAVILAAVTYPVFLTGEPAEDRLEEASWVRERLIHDHEERAEVALVAVLVAGSLGALGLWQSRKGRPLPRATALLTLGGLVLSAGLFARTALAGGVIRHEEIRPGAVQTVAEEGTGRVAPQPRDNDPDDRD
jgi:hypothetical protein